MKKRAIWHQQGREKGPLSVSASLEGDEGPLLPLHVFSFT